MAFGATTPFGLYVASLRYAAPATNGGDAPAVPAQAPEAAPQATPGDDGPDDQAPAASAGRDA